LNNLIILVDVNALGQSQGTMYEHNCSNYEHKFNSFGLNTLVIDGHKIEDIVNALKNAKSQTDKPTAIVCNTIKGKGFLDKIEGKLNWHGKDLGSDYDSCLEGLKNKIKHT
jgi:transketolase